MKERNWHWNSSRELTYVWITVAVAVLAVPHCKMQSCNLSLASADSRGHCVMTATTPPGRVLAGTCCQCGQRRSWALCEHSIGIGGATWLEPVLPPKILFGVGSIWSGQSSRHGQNPCISGFIVNSHICHVHLHSLLFGGFPNFTDPKLPGPQASSEEIPLPTWHCSKISICFWSWCRVSLAAFWSWTRLTMQVTSVTKTLWGPPLPSFSDIMAGAIPLPNLVWNQSAYLRLDWQKAPHTPWQQFWESCGSIANKVGMLGLGQHVIVQSKEEGTRTFLS